MHTYAHMNIRQVKREQIRISSATNQPHCERVFWSAHIVITDLAAILNIMSWAGFAGGGIYLQFNVFLGKCFFSEI